MIVLRLELELMSDMLVGSEHREGRTVHISRQESYADVPFLGEILQTREDVVALLNVRFVAPFIE